MCNNSNHGQWRTEREHAKLTPPHTQNRPMGANSTIFPTTQQISRNFSHLAPALRPYLCSAAHRFPGPVQLYPAARTKFPKSYQKNMKTASRLQKLPSTNTSFSPRAVHNFKKFENQPQSRIQPDLNPRPCDRESRTLRTTPPRARAKHRAIPRHLSLLVLNRTLRVKFAHFPAFPIVGQLLKPCANGNDVTVM